MNNYDDQAEGVCEMCSRYGADPQTGVCTNCEDKLEEMYDQENG